MNIEELEKYMTKEEIDEINKKVEEGIEKLLKLVIVDLAHVDLERIRKEK